MDISPLRTKTRFHLYRNASYIVFWNTEWRKKILDLCTWDQSWWKGKAYPVLYLLDGDSFFHSVVGFTRFFSSSKTSNLPPCIVVAVLNTDRTRDFTPTCSAARRDGTICPYDKPAGGGAEQFHRFLIEELRLEVENKVPANGTNFLVGHSYAGLFTLQTLSNHPESFDSYIAIDPSLWWDRGVFLQQAAKNVYQKDFSSKHLYVAFATRQRPAIKLIQFSLADSLKIRSSLKWKQAFACHL